jgi:IS5 family transposase
VIVPDFEEAFSKEWVKEHIRDRTNELVILREVIPWQKIIEQLVAFYCEGKGKVGKSLRMMVALLTVQKLRHLSDEKVVSQVKENRYIQYFCNVADEGLHTFVDSSTLCTFRKRLGAKGMAIMESKVFELLRGAGVIKRDAQLMDSTVMESNIVYPTDVLLLYKAFGKMKQFAQANQIRPWWDERHLKKRWRAYNLAKQKEKAPYLWELYFLFRPALWIFRALLESCTFPGSQGEKGLVLLKLLSLLDAQTQQKLRGEKHIENRIVSLDEVDGRPIKKGKSYPSCEFGTTLQMSFTREGFMVTAENFIGQPGDKTLYPSTLDLYRERMRGYPDKAITDQGFRSPANFKVSKDKVEHVFMGKSLDVSEQVRDYCQRARSATEGFIAVCKNWRGFGRSLYHGFEGDKIWTCLCQMAHNLKKLLQLYRNEEIEEDSLVKLGLLPP